MFTRQAAANLIQAEFHRLSDIDINFPTHTSFPSFVYRPIESNMAAKTVATIIAKTLEDTPKFSGKSDQNVDEWLKDLSAKFHMAEITEPQALKIISTFLEGPVKEWFLENNTTFESWSHFKEIFRNTYASPAVKQLASHRLRTRQQRIDEPIIEYYTDVMKLCKTIDPAMTDASKIDHLCHGLKQSLLREVLRHAPQTPAEFLEHAKREEVLDCLVNTSLNTTINTDPSTDCTSMYHVNTQPQVAAVNSSSTYRFPGPRRAQMTQPASHSTYQNRFQPPSARSRPFRCFNCNRPGHIARDCWSTKNY
jgi:hypothetical protein